MTYGNSIYGCKPIGIARVAEINPVKATCKCGHVIPFYHNVKKVCWHCGRTVYPSDKAKVVDRLIKEIKKK